MAGGMLLPAGELSLLDQPREILRASDQHALHEHHGKGGPAGPHLEDEAAAPFAEIAAVLEVLVREAGGGERLPRLLRKRIHPHADDDDVVRRHGRLDFLQDVCAVARDLLAHGGMDLRFGEDSAGHMEFLFVCGLPAAYARTAAPLSASAGRNQRAVFFLRVRTFSRSASASSNSPIRPSLWYRVTIPAARRNVARRFTHDLQHAFERE